MSRFYDRQGNPIDLQAWSSLMNDEPYCVVQQDVVNGVRISTVWLGLNHRLGGEGEPLIFETKLFGGPRDGDQHRYSTEAQARIGHESLVAAFRHAQQEVQ